MACSPAATICHPSTASGPDAEILAHLAPPGTAAVDSAWVLRYAHPLTAFDTDVEQVRPVLDQTHWHEVFSPGALEAMVFDRVDRYFAPIGGWRCARSTGPAISVGRVGLDLETPQLPPTRDFYAILYRLRQANLAVADEDWRQVVEVNTQLLRQAPYLRQLIASSYLHRLCLDLGTAWSALGHQGKAEHYRDQARLLRRQLHFP